MPTIAKEIAEKFLAEVAGGKDLSAEQLDALRALLQRDKKPKADEFVKIFTLAPGGDLT